MNKYMVNLCFRIKDHYLNLCPIYFDNLEEAKAYVRGINFTLQNVNTYIRRANADVSGNISIQKTYEEVVEVI